MKTLTVCCVLLFAATAAAQDWKALADEAKRNALITQDWADESAGTMQARKATCETDRASATNLKALSEALCTPPCAHCIAGHVHTGQANNYWGYGGTSEGQANTAYGTGNQKMTAGNMAYMLMQYQQAYNDYLAADSAYWTANGKYVEAREHYATAENQYQDAILDYNKCGNIDL